MGKSGLALTPKDYSKGRRRGAKRKKKADSDGEASVKNPAEKRTKRRESHHRNELRGRVVEDGVDGKASAKGVGLEGSSFECQQCAKAFATVTGLLTHQGKSLCGREDVEKNRNCPYCDTVGIPSLEITNHVLGTYCKSKRELQERAGVEERREREQLEREERLQKGGLDSAGTARGEPAGAESEELPEEPLDYEIDMDIVGTEVAALGATEMYDIPVSEVLFQDLLYVQHKLPQSAVQTVRDLLHGKHEGFKATDVFRNQAEAQAVWDEARGLAYCGGDLFSAKRIEESVREVPLKDEYLNELVEKWRFHRSALQRMMLVVLDPEAALQQLFRQVDISNPELFIKKGAPLFNEHGERLYGHPTTADAFLAAQKEREETGREGVTLGLYLYADKTTRNSFHRQEFYPVYLTFANFTKEVYHTDKAKVVAAFLPVLKRPRNERNKANTKKDAYSFLEETIYKEYWEEILQPYTGICRNGIKFVPEEGEPIVFWPRILAFNGDHPELQAACGCESNGRSQMPCRVCQVSREDMGHFFDIPGDPQRPRLRVAAETVYLLNNYLIKKKTLTAQRKMRSEKGLAHTVTAWLGVLFPVENYKEHGIHLATVQDWLHWVLLGVVRDVLKQLLRIMIACWEDVETFREKVNTFNARLQALPPYTCTITGRRETRFKNDVYALKNKTASQYSDLMFQLRHAIGSVPDDVLPSGVYELVVDAFLELEKAYVGTYYGGPWTETQLFEQVGAWKTVFSKLMVAFGPPDEEDDGGGGDQEQGVNGDGDETSGTDGDESNSDSGGVGSGGGTDDCDGEGTTEGGEEATKSKKKNPYLSLEKPKTHAYNHIPDWVKLHGALFYSSVISMESLHRKIVKTWSLQENYRGSTAEKKLLAHNVRTAFVEVVAKALKKAEEKDVSAAESADYTLAPKRSSMTLDTDTRLPDGLRDLFVEHLNLVLADEFDLWDKESLNAAKQTLDAKDFYTWKKAHAPQLLTAETLSRVKVYNSLRVTDRNEKAASIVASRNWYSNKADRLAGGGNGKPRFDFVVLDDDDDDDEPQIGQILFFFSYTLRDLPSKPGEVAPSPQGPEGERKRGRAKRAEGVTYRGAFVRWLNRLEPSKLREVKRIEGVNVLGDLYAYGKEASYDPIPIADIHRTVRCTPDFALNRRLSGLHSPTGYLDALFDPRQRAYFNVDLRIHEHNC